MKQLISLEDLRKYAFQQSFSKPEYRSLENFLESLMESDLLTTFIQGTDYYLYPKYLWQEKKNIELFFFTPFNLIKSTYDEEKIMIETLFLKDITQIMINIPKTNIDIEMYLIFKNGSEITFTSNDSNQTWKYKFYQAILAIYTNLTKNINELSV